MKKMCEASAVSLCSTLIQKWQRIFCVAKIWLANLGSCWTIEPAAAGPASWWTLPACGVALRQT